jgi:hypothetical protein
MTKTARIAVITLAAALSLLASAQPNLGCTTIAIQYVGKTDRPVFPIIISSSPDEAERYKQKLFSDPISTFARVYIVRESIMKKIAEIHLPNGDLKLPNSDDIPKTKPTLSVVLAAGHNDREVIVEAAASVSLLGEIKKRVYEYPQLVEQLSDLQNRMNRYLKSAGTSIPRSRVVPWLMYDELQTIST